MGVLHRLRGSCVYPMVVMVLHNDEERGSLSSLCAVRVVVGANAECDLSLYSRVVWGLWGAQTLGHVGVGIEWM